MPGGIQLGPFVEAATIRGHLPYRDHPRQPPRRPPIGGFPDLRMIRGDSLIAAELKVGTNATTKAQYDWLAAFGIVPGCTAVVWRPDAPPLAERWWRWSRQRGRTSALSGGACGADLPLTEYVGDRLLARPARHLVGVGRLRALVLDKLPAGDPKAPGRLQHVRFHDASFVAASTSASVNPRASRWRLEPGHALVPRLAFAPPLPGCRMRPAAASHRSRSA